MTPTLTLALLSLTTLMAACSVLGYPTGAPAEACKSLTPRHYSVPQLDPGTISLVVSKRVNGTLQEVVHYKPNMTYQVTLRTERDRDVFCKGFLIQARLEANGQLLDHVGAGFKKPRTRRTLYKLSNCSPPSSGVTHTDKSEKEKVEFEWVAPPASAGPIQFRYTCVQHFNYYYVDLRGPTLMPDPQAPTGTPLVRHTTVTPTPTSSGRNVQTNWITMAVILIAVAVFMGN